MKNHLIAEIENMPKALVVEIVSGIGFNEVVYSEGEIKCPDGTILTEDAYDFLRDYVEKTNESDLEDVLTLQTTYIVTVSNIEWDRSDDDDDDDGDDEMPTELTFIFYGDEDEDEDESMYDYIHNVIDDKISNETGFCFKSCELLIEKYEPYNSTN